MSYKGSDDVISKEIQLEYYKGNGYFTKRHCYKGSDNGFRKGNDYIQRKAIILERNLLCDLIVQLVITDVRGNTDYREEILVLGRKYSS